MNQGTGKAVIFSVDADRRVFLGLLAALELRFGVRVCSFALLGNHYHLLVRSLRGELSEAMHWLGTHYAKSYNRRHDRVGAFFRGRFTSKLVEDHRYLAWLPHYIHLNPVKDGFAATPEAWRWSSYRQTIGLELRWPWLATDDVLHGRSNEDFRWDAEIHRAQLADFDGGTSAEELLQDWTDAPFGLNRRAEEVAQIEAAVCTAFGVELADVLTPSRRPNQARTLAIALVAQRSRLSRGDVADRYGLRSGASVTAASRRSGASLSDPVLLARLERAGLPR